MGMLKTSFKLEQQALEGPFAAGLTGLGQMKVAVASVQRPRGRKIFILHESLIGMVGIEVWGEYGNCEAFDEARF